MLYEICAIEKVSKFDKLRVECIVYMNIEVTGNDTAAPSTQFVMHHRTCVCVCLISITTRTCNSTVDMVRFCPCMCHVAYFGTEYKIQHHLLMI